MLTEFVASFLGIKGTDDAQSSFSPSSNNPNKSPSSLRKKKNSLMMDGSTAASTPTSALSLVDENSPFFHMCCHPDSGSDQAVSLKEYPSLNDDVVDEEDEIQLMSRRLSTAATSPLRNSSNNNHTSSMRLSPPRVTTTKTSSSRRSSERRNWEPPKSIAVYQPRQSWPDGTLQILWQTPERNVHGMKGIDRFEAHLELTLDDLSTIDIASSVDGSGTPEICSKYSGLSIELHPDETRVHKIGSISCYRVRSQPALQQIDQLDVPPECPQQLSDLLYQLPQKSFFQSWCKPKKATRRIRKPLPLGGEEGNDDELVVEEFIHDDNETSEEDGNAFQEELYRRHHWHPESSKVASYLWVEDLQVDERYRGSGLGFCLLEDACQRVADSNSWMLAHVPETLSGGSSSSRPPQEHPLREYFGLFGFHQMYGENRENTTNSSLEDTDGGATAGSFMARWNASPANPRLEEVLPSVPYTTQQSRDQGFQL